MRIRRLTASRPRTHHASPTSTAPRTAETWLLIGRDAPQRDERHEHHRREGRERQEAPARRLAIRAENRQDVLVGGGRDVGAAIKKRDGLEDEMVVDPVVAGEPVDQQRGPDESGADGHRGDAIEPVARGFSGL